MKLVRPVTVTDSVFATSTVATSSLSEWNDSDTYNTGNQVKVSTIASGATSQKVHHEYESIGDSNTDNYPPDNVAGSTGTTLWLDLGSTNRWKMFDGQVGTRTESLGSISVDLIPGGINTVGLLDIVANSASVKVSIDATTIYDSIQSLVISNVTNWYEYFFEPIIRKTDVVFTDLPISESCTATITLVAGALETCKCGLCIPGFWRELGMTQWGAGVGIADYSKKETDTFGNTVWTKRSNAKILSTDLYLDNNQVDETHRLLSAYTATPVLWIGSELYTSTIIYGAYKDFDIVIKGPEGSFCSLEIEGLI